MAKEKIIAALDIGSTSVFLLLARLTPEGRVVPVNEFMGVTRLAEDIVDTCLISDKAMDDTIKAAREMQDIAMKEGASNLIVTATSALRLAANRSKFLLKFNQALNIYPQVLSGKEEARFTYIGAVMDFDNDRPAFLMTVGGAGSELACGVGGNVELVFSFDFGFSQIMAMLNSSSKKSFLGFDSSESARVFINTGIDKSFDEIKSWLDAHPKTINLVSGGAALNYAGLIKRQQIYDREQLVSVKSSARELLGVYKATMKMSPADRASAPGMEKDYADILPGALLIMHTVFTRFNLGEFIVTPNGLRAGIIKRFASRNNLR